MVGDNKCILIFIASVPCLLIMSLKNNKAFENLDRLSNIFAYDMQLKVRIIPPIIIKCSKYCCEILPGWLDSG